LGSLGLGAQTFFDFSLSKEFSLSKFAHYARFKVNSIISQMVHHESYYNKLVQINEQCGFYWQSLFHYQDVDFLMVAIIKKPNNLWKQGDSIRID
jgi:hypothetical protein